MRTLLFSLSNLSAEHYLFGLFAVIILIFLIMDLGFFQKKAHVISLKSALWQSIFWVSISLLFGVLIWKYYQPAPSPEGIIRTSQDAALEFISAYLMEWSLSVDNIFVFVLILGYFKVPEEFRHKVLYYGILGAHFFRAVFITVGIYLIAHFHFLLYVFGAILIITGIKMLLKKDDDEFDPQKNIVYRLLNKYFRCTPDMSEGKFFVKKDGKTYMTTLFVVIALIETTDIIFALDSIPAVFAISQDKFIIYTSNIFAVMGLRAMFFLLVGIVGKFRFLQHGISIILVFIGVKMLLGIWDIHMETWVSLATIVVCLAGSILLSLAIPEKKK